MVSNSIKSLTTSIHLLADYYTLILFTFSSLICSEFPRTYFLSCFYHLVLCFHFYFLDRINLSICSILIETHQHMKYTYFLLSINYSRVYWENICLRRDVNCQSIWHRHHRLIICMTETNILWLEILEIWGIENIAFDFLFGNLLYISLIIVKYSIISNFYLNFIVV